MLTLLIKPHCFRGFLNVLYDFLMSIYEHVAPQEVLRGQCNLVLQVRRRSPLTWQLLTGHVWNPGSLQETFDYIYFTLKFDVRILHLLGPPQRLFFKDSNCIFFPVKCWQISYNIIFYSAYVSIIASHSKVVKGVNQLLLVIKLIILLLLLQ